MEKAVIALGFFDGVHRGHGALLEKTAERARELQAVPTAFTFDRPPKEVVTGQPVYLINSSRDRQGLMERLYGIERVVFAPFDRQMMTMPWEEYIGMLLRDYGAVHFVAGHDHRFGHKNAGNVQLLQEKCAQLGIGCDIIPPVQWDGITVSSTYIRTLVEAGDMERAAEFLGHRHCLSQTVQHGQRIGRTIGIPTVNLAVPEHVLAPAHGVYVTCVYLPDGRMYHGVTNVGTRPTVTDGDAVSTATCTGRRYASSSAVVSGAKRNSPRWRNCGRRYSTTSARQNAISGNEKRDSRRAVSFIFSSVLRWPE